MYRVTLTFDARCKSRLLVELENGERAGLLIERGRILRGGDRVSLADGREAEIIAANEPLIEATSDDIVLVAKAAYHLGNRHVAVQVMKDRLRCLEDHVLADMLRGLKLEVNSVTAPFEPESGAYGAHHAHASEMLPPRPKIHEFSSTRSKP
jgi:urease accessory protein